MLSWHWCLLVLGMKWCWARDTISSFRKCCLDSEELNLNNYKCEQTDPSVLDSRMEHLQMVAQQMNYIFLKEKFGFPICDKLSAFFNEDLRYLNQNLILTMSDYCVDSTTDNNEVLVACIPLWALESASNRVNVRKCCSMFQMVVKEPLGSCNATEKSFQPKFFDKENVTFEVNLHLNAVDFITSECQDKDLLSSDVYGEVKLLTNGSLFIPKYEDLPKSTFSQDEFCIDNVEGFDAVQAFYCYPPPREQENNLNIVLTAVGLIISIIFLAVTFLLYACELKKLNLHGRTLMCHVGSITVAFICLATLQLQTLGYTMPEELCDLTAYVMLLAFLSAFSWLNVMSIDIWRTFRSIRSRDTTTRNRKVVRFAIYSLYAWGTPTLLTSATITVAHHEVLPIAFTPVIENCWISRENYAYHLFFIAPISCVIVCNITLYVITAWRCYQVKKNISNFHNADKSQKNKYFRKKDQLVLSTKLFLVMGITWSMEVISFLFKETDASFMWYLSDTVNALYGLIVFAIFALKKKNLRNFSRRFSTWVEKKRLGSEAFLNLRKTSTTFNPSTISTTCTDQITSYDTDNANS